MAHFIGGIVVVIGLILTSWPGVKYGIPFPVLARSSFGSNGSQFCTLTRGAVAILWLSFQVHCGGALPYLAGGYNIAHIPRMQTVAGDDDTNTDGDDASVRLWEGGIKYLEGDRDRI